MEMWLGHDDYGLKASIEKGKQEINKLLQKLV
jgi:hypothetical protein